LELPGKYHRPRKRKGIFLLRRERGWIKERASGAIEIKRGI